MSLTTLPGYRCDDLPACLAAAGLVRVLTRDAGWPVRLAWCQDYVYASLELPAGRTLADATATLQRIATQRAKSPLWDLLDLADDPAGWMNTADRRPETALWAAGAYEYRARETASGRGKKRQTQTIQVVHGGRSPLLCASRGTTPGAWARKACQRAAEMDWRRHWGTEPWHDIRPEFECTRDGTWQGWRRSSEHYPAQRVADPAMLWLACEGLIAHWPCTLRPPYEGAGDATGRRDVLCPGWHPTERAWRYPIWETLLDTDQIGSLIGGSAHTGKCARYRRINLRQGPVLIREFEQARIA